MEVLGFIGAILGVVAAIISRKKIVRHEHVIVDEDLVDEYDRRSYNSPAKRRFKRFFISGLASFIAILIIGATNDPAVQDSALDVTLVFIFFALSSIAAYQLVAWVFILLRSVWD